MGEEGCEAILIYLPVLSLAVSNQLNLRGISHYLSALKQRERERETHTQGRRRDALCFVGELVLTCSLFCKDEGQQHFLHPDSRCRESSKGS